MSPYRRNVVVGLTVIVGLAGLSVMLLSFGGKTVGVLRRGDRVQIELISDRADGLAEGAQVLYRGVNVGRVASVRRESNNLDVVISALIAGDLPENVTGSIRTVSLVSGISAIELRLVGGPDAKPMGNLKNGQQIRGRYVGADLIPPEIMAQFESLGVLIKGLNNYVNDPGIHQDLQASINNFHQITDTLRRTSANIDRFSDRLDQIGVEASATLQDAHETVKDAHTTVKATQADVERITRQFDDRMLQLSKSLDNVQSITQKVNNGQGTAGLLLNDPKLYQSLVDNSKQLT